MTSRLGKRRRNGFSLPLFLLRHDGGGERKGNHDWKMGEKKDGSGVSKKTSGNIRKTMTPGPSSLKRGTLWKPNRWAMARGVGDHHDHGVGAKSGVTL
jgi:hypothetical protein